MSWLGFQHLSFGGRLRLAAFFTLSVTVGQALLGADPAVDPNTSGLHIGTAPAWIEPVAWSVPPGPPPAGAAAQVFLSDEQDNLTTEGGDYYVHLVIKLLTAEGVSRNAQQTASVSPEYQTVTWHTLKLYRDGQTIDRLSTTQFKKLQRELGLEEQMVTGETTYATVLDDVRVGDVLETAYTLHDNNPLFKGRLGTRHYFGHHYPIAHEQVSIRLPASGPNARLSFLVPDGTAGLPNALYRMSALRSAADDQTEGTKRIIRWDATDLPAITFEQPLPPRAYPFWPQMRVSSFTTWADVVEWAEPLFAVDTKLPEPLTAQIEKWKQLPDAAQRLAAAVHWVQDDVRYFALDLGEHTLRPRPLADVCSTRFGDCKDKALLLSTILRALGFEAWPALVNTYWRDRLHDIHPDPYAFNHAIVAYNYKDRLHWIDATLKNQQGPIGEWAMPPYRTALLIRHGVDDLTDIVPPVTAEPDSLTVDHIAIDAESGDATMDTVLTLRGLEADSYRQEIETVSAEERSKRWFNFIARFYRRLEEVQPPTTSDDNVANVVTIRARYHLPEFLQKEGSEPYVATYAYSLRSILNLPETRRRHWPYALPSDRFVRHRVEIELPFDEPVAQEPNLIRTEGVLFRVERGVAGRRFVAQHDLRVTGDFVPADRMSQFCDDTEEILNELSSVVRKPANPVQSASPSTPASPRSD